MSFSLDNILGLVNLLRFTDFFINNTCPSIPKDPEYHINSEKLIYNTQYRKEWMQYLQYLKD